MSEIRIAIPDLDLNNALRLDGNLRNYEIGPCRFGFFQNDKF